MMGALHREVGLGEMLVQALTLDPSREILLRDNEPAVSAGAMVDRLDQYLGAFARIGLRSGQRVAVLSRNCPELFEITGALMLANIAMVPLHPMGSLEDYIFAIDDTGVSSLIFDASHYGEIGRAIFSRFPNLKMVALGETEVGHDLLEMVVAASADPTLRAESTPDDISRIIMTGGTTGRPKSILLSQRAMTTMLTIQQTCWDWPENVRALICTPMSHSGIALMMPTILRGGCIKMMSAFDVEKFMATVQKHKITCTLLVPTMIYAILDHPRRNEYDLSSLECVYYGASSINPARLRQAIEAFGSIFFQFYGQSEAPLSVTVMRRKDHDISDTHRLSSCGRPVPWVRVRLLDEDNREVPKGTPGEICCQGPLVMEGYIGIADQNATALAGDWLHTGDIAVEDGDGFLRIIDRKKDMIISGGFNVYPREVEDVLESHGAVQQAAVVGLPDPKWGERVAAMVVLHDGKLASKDELQDLVRHQKGPVQVPKDIFFSESIPLSTVGKADKKAVRSVLLAVGS